MSLPQVKAPKFDTKLPSNGESVKYRPFLVKEQKLVLQAIEMKDQNQLNNALDDVLKDCTFHKLDIDSLPVYDIEHLIMQIRSKSVGEMVEINFVCQNHIEDKLLNIEQLKHQPSAEEKRGPGKCETKIPLRINLAQLEVKKAKRPDNVVMFTETIGVVLRDLPYGVYKKISGSTVDNGLNAIAACIESVIDGESVHNRGDFTNDELIGWVESLVSDDFDKMDEWIKSMPTLKMELPIICPSCGAKDTVHLEGLDDFLA